MANAYEGEFRNYGREMDYTPAAVVSAGQVVVLNDMIGVAKKDIEASRKGSLALEGIFRMAKDDSSGSAIALGKLVYWDDANNVVTETASTHVKFGYVVAAAADGDDTVIVKKVLLD